MNKEHIIGIILARKGSKRLKNKNLKKINGRSLCEITIKFAKKLKFLKNIVLSTDDKKLFSLSRKNKILSPGLRPKKLSEDKSSSEDAAFHVIKWYEKKFRKITGLLLLQPTTPYRDIANFKKAFSIFSKRNNTVIGATKIYKNPNNFYIGKKKIKFSKNKKNYSSFYFIDGSLYLISRKNFFKEKKFLPKKFTPVFNKKFKNSLDIDFQKDLKLARLLSNENL